MRAQDKKSGTTFHIDPKGWGNNQLLRDAFAPVLGSAKQADVKPAQDASAAEPSSEKDK